MVKHTRRAAFLPAALLICCGLLLTGCELRITSKDEPVTTTQPAPETTLEEGSAYTTEAPEDDGQWAPILAGQWHAMNSVGAGFDERWLFDGESGEFIHGASDYDMLNRTPFESGTWRVEGNRLLLTIEYRIQLIGGEIKTADGEQYIDDPEVREVILNPPEKRTIVLGGGQEDPESGRFSLTLDGVAYYDYSSQPDLFDAYYYYMGISGD